MKTYFFLLLFPFMLFSPLGNCLIRGIPEYVQLDNEARLSLKEYAIQLGKEEGFEVLSLGTTAVVEGKGEGLWCLNIMCRKPQNLEESRTYTLSLLNKLYAHMRDVPLYNKAIASMYQKYGNPVRPYYQPELTTHQFALKLSYWDANFDRFPKPSVSQVRVINNKLYFYYANTSQALEEPPLEEVWTNSEKPWQ